MGFPHSQDLHLDVEVELDDFEPSERVSDVNELHPASSPIKTSPLATAHNLGVDLVDHNLGEATDPAADNTPAGNNLGVDHNLDEAADPAADNNLGEYRGALHNPSETDHDLAEDADQESTNQRISVHEWLAPSATDQESSEPLADVELDRFLPKLRQHNLTASRLIGDAVSAEDSGHVSATTKPLVTESSEPTPSSEKTLDSASTSNPTVPAATQSERELSEPSQVDDLSGIRGPEPTQVIDATGPSQAPSVAEHSEPQTELQSASPQEQAVEQTELKFPETRSPRSAEMISPADPTTDQSERNLSEPSQVSELSGIRSPEPTEVASVTDGAGGHQGNPESHAPSETLGKLPSQEEAELHPVKAKLLARAAEARRARSTVSPAPDSLRLEVELPTDPEDARHPGLPRRTRSFDEELGKIGRPVVTGSRPPSAPQLKPRRGQLSPQLIAIFGTLLGLALIASLTALAVNLDANRAAPAPSASVLAAPAEDKTPPTVQKPERKKTPGPWRIAELRNDPNVQIVEGQIGSKPFLRAVQDAGIETRQAYRALTVLKGLRDLDKCAHTDRFIAALERSSRRLKAFEYIVRAEEVYQAREGSDGLLQAKALDLKLERGQIRGVIRIDGGFAHSAKQAGFDSGLAEAVREALDGHMRLEDFQRGDLVRIVAQEVTVLGEFARYAGIEALEYRPKDGSDPLRLYYLQTPQAKAHYDAQGRAPYEGGWRIPVEGARVTSKFNPQRMHPILKKLMPHTGTDFGANTGDLVGASSYGTVTFIGWAGPSGNLVKVMHPGNIETGYAHLSRFAEGLKVGDKVKRMQLVGYVGSTGRSTAPHLHFSARRDGVFIDAETLKLNALRVLPAADRPAFELVKTRYDQLLDSIELPAAPPADVAATVAEPAAGPADDPGALDPDLGEIDPQAAANEPAAAAQAAAPAEPTPPIVAPAAAAPAPGTPTNAARSTLQLSDQELLKLQGATDDGEVEQ